MTASPRFYTPTERQAILDTLIEAFRADTRLLGVILVGSGSTGFDDDFSDLDFSLVVADQYETRTVFESWQEKMEGLLDVVQSFQVEINDNNFLHGFLLHNYLELDIGFLNLENLFAKRPRWRVIHDPTGAVTAKMEATAGSPQLPDTAEIYHQRLATIWHYILHTVTTAKRGHYWRALYYLNHVRDRAIELACLSRGLMHYNYRQVDQLPQDIQRKFKRTMVVKVNEQEIMEKAQAAARLFFTEANSIAQAEDLKTAPRLEQQILRVFEIFQKLPQNDVG